MPTTLESKLLAQVVMEHTVPLFTLCVEFLMTRWRFVHSHVFICIGVMVGYSLVNLAGTLISGVPARLTSE